MDQVDGGTELGKYNTAQEKIAELNSLIPNLVAKQTMVAGMAEQVESSGRDEDQKIEEIRREIYKHRDIEGDLQRKLASKQSEKDQFSLVKSEPICSRCLSSFDPENLGIVLEKCDQEIATLEHEIAKTKETLTEVQERGSGKSTQTRHLS